MIDPPFGLCHLETCMIIGNLTKCFYRCEALRPDGRRPADLVISAGQRRKAEVHDCSTAERCSSGGLGSLFDTEAVATCCCL